jgi:hypothetical protein
MVPTYHIDYEFLPSAWLANVTHFEVGRFADRCGNGLSDHVPIVLIWIFDVAFGSRAVLGCGGENSRCASSSYRSRHMTWNAMQPVFVIDSLRASVGPGQRSRMASTLSRRTISAADYFVDEDAATMLEYVERLKRSD